VPRPRRKPPHSGLQPPAPGAGPALRCAIYTRKSTSEGLDQAFNSLDAQRESAEAYVASQKQLGWVVLPEHYDDGGFSGGTIERPALQRLMEHIAAGQVDCIVVYKVDRLSRSLMDFARLMKLFEQRHVHFVSVTQHFNTADSMGRLTLNILLSFAQFEREVIGERTRDKIAAARRKGQWSGGWPILGYDLDFKAHRLTVNPQEAEQVRAIFGLYLQHESLLATVEAANALGYRTKSWTTSQGNSIGGKPFDKGRMNYLLTNVAYLGKVRHREDVYEGEHEAILDQATWDRVQAVLARNAANKGALLRNTSGALLKGLLQCGACRRAMIHSVASRGTRQHRYYVCSGAQKNGHASCPTKSINARSIEQEVLTRLRSLPFDDLALASSPLAEPTRLLQPEADVLPASEQARLLRLFLQQVTYDGATRRLALELTEDAAACVKATA
jgi:site-specific DNA recombinase